MDIHEVFTWKRTSFLPVSQENVFLHLLQMMALIRLHDAHVNISRIFNVSLGKLTEEGLEDKEFIQKACIFPAEIMDVKIMDHLKVTKE